MDQLNRIGLIHFYFVNFKLVNVIIIIDKRGTKYMTEFITTNLNYFAYAMMAIGAILIILALFFMLKGRRRRK